MDHTSEDKQIKDKITSKSYRKYFREYTDSTSLHGLKYLGEKANTRFEKFTWFIAFLTSVGLCGYLIAHVWIKWKETPVIVTFGETETSIWKIPFPAITICSQQAFLSSTYNFKHYCSKDAILTDEERFKFSAISLVCNMPEICPQPAYEFLNETAIEIVKNVTKTVNDTIFFCDYNRVKNCEFYFKPVVLGGGACYSFNMLGFNEIFRDNVVNKEYGPQGNLNQGWTLQSGYPPDSDSNIYPYRANGIGLSAGFWITLREKKDEIEDTCTGHIEGYRIAFHLPSSIPPLNEDYMWLTKQSDLIFTIEPQLMTTSNNLIKYDYQKRKCYLENERYLRYFRWYSQENCEIECKTNHTLKLCGCVEFSMPHEDGTKLCATPQTPCVEQAAEELFLLEQTDDKTLNKAKNKYEKCKCLPSCTSLTYKQRVSQITTNISRIVGLTKDVFNYDYTFVKVAFSSPQFISSQRSELYGTIDFLANCGGLLGVCLGFSILSLVEIIYFISLRCICRYYKKKK